MRLTVRVKPKSKRASVTETGDGELIVAVHETPTDGQANAAVIKAIAKHFGATPSRVRIVHGLANRNKIVEIQEAG